MQGAVDIIMVNLSIVYRHCKWKPYIFPHSFNTHHKQHTDIRYNHYRVLATVPCIFTFPFRMDTTNLSVFKLFLPLCVGISPATCSLCLGAQKIK